MPILDSEWGVKCGGVDEIIIHAVKLYTNEVGLFVRAVMMHDFTFNCVGCAIHDDVHTEKCTNLGRFIEFQASSTCTNV